MESKPRITGHKLLAGVVAGALALGMAGAALADNDKGMPEAAGTVDNLGFVPVAGPNPLPATEIQLPPGFKARVIVKPGDPIAGGAYATNPDMNVLDPTGRYLFTSHEIFDAATAAVSGSLTRTDLQTGETVTLVSGRRAADGLKWTPWGTLLLGEEYPAGGIWEVNPWSGAHERRHLLGTFSHEGIAIAKDGTVYLGDEYSQGAIYKFVPRRPLTRRSLTEGTLYALKAGEGWIRIDDPAGARAEAIAKGATLFNRPEDIEIRKGTIYVAITGEHRVIAIEDEDGEPEVRDFVKAGANVAADQFQMPDKSVPGSGCGPGCGPAAPGHRIPAA